MWIDLRGSFSSDGSPANISCSSARTTAPGTDSGSGSAASSSPGAPSRMAVRMASISVVMPATEAYRQWQVGRRVAPGYHSR